MTRQNRGREPGNDHPNETATTLGYQEPGSTRPLPGRYRRARRSGPGCRYGPHPVSGAWLAGRVRRARHPRQRVHLGPAPARRPAPVLRRLAALAQATAPRRAARRLRLHARRRARPTLGAERVRTGRELVRGGLDVVALPVFHLTNPTL